MTSELRSHRGACPQIDKALSGFRQEYKLTLVDFKLEFGRFKDSSSSPTGVSRHLPHLGRDKAAKSWIKTASRRNLGNVKEAYGKSPAVWASKSSARKPLVEFFFLLIACFSNGAADRQACGAVEGPRTCSPSIGSASAGTAR